MLLSYHFLPMDIAKHKPFTSAIKSMTNVGILHTCDLVAMGFVPMGLLPMGLVPIGLVPMG